uniref:Methyl-accepting chemotaxis protein n=1 Tax=wastewater metagenome TaxID=527639 RepID=A0A0A8KXM9_9ZZZZ
MKYTRITFSIHSISTKLMLSFSFLGLLPVIQSIYSLWSIQQIKKPYVNYLISVKTLANAEQDLNTLRLLVFQLLNKTNQDEIDKLKQSIEALSNNLATEALSEGQTSVLLKKALSEYQQIIQLHADFQVKKAYNLIYADSQLTQDNLHSLIEREIKTEEEKANKSIVYAESRVRFYSTLMIFTAALSIVLLVIIFVRMIVKPIYNVVQAIQPMAQGDLVSAQKLDVSDDTKKHKNELKILSSSICTTAKKLGTIIGTVSDNSLAIASSSESLAVVATQLAASMQHISSSTSDVVDKTDALYGNINSIAAASEQLSSSASSVSDSVQAISSSIEEVAKSCQHEHRIAQKAYEQTMDTRQIMRKLSDSATEIGTILELIRTIARQTNLLSLNATIEAARAGTSGKGFAVVANEVKQLANQSAEAADQIADIITQIQKNAEQSNIATDETARIIDDVQESARSVSVVVEKQNTMTREIADNINDVSRATKELAVNTQSAAQVASILTSNMQNIKSELDIGNSGITETHRSISALSGIASELKNIVKQFRV